MRARPRSDDPVEATEQWFLEHGLSYFVPQERAAAREALRPRRTVPLAIAVALFAAAVGGLLGWFSDQVSAAPAVWLSLLLLFLLWYAIKPLHGGPILRWALGRTLTSVRLLVPMASRALPLLLVFVTFLFINAEAWQMTSSLPFSMLWLVALLLEGLAVLFLLVRLPEEVDRVDDAVDGAAVVRACRGTPLEELSRELADDPDVDLAEHAQITGYDRWNLIAVLLVVQVVQVLLLVVAVFAFFLFFGSLIMNEEVQSAWTGLSEGEIRHLPYLTNVSVSLVKVSVFLASFSGLYFTVAAVTDDTYRGQFFASVESQLERAVGVRAAYLALRSRT